MRISSDHVLPRTAPVTGKTRESDARVFVADTDGEEHDQAP